MQMSHEIDGRILIINQNGVTDPDEIIRAMRAALDDPRLEPGSHLLWNAVDAPARADADKMRRLLAGTRDTGGKLSSRCAILVSNELQFGVSRMFSVYSESAKMQVEVFYDMASARAWLLEQEDDQAGDRA